ncbi:PREDICTED: uncharacterized protein LOC104812078 [Tarenaya hassleriana]|uniref:uncharacterized protein LOC104812078 n=1 Tax=Tarenaya hassleriana TaxID=28532 RepID=UPI00053C96FA|nr:PREDICTED: uncharacterized protein LOC104812078 [Tarenaya hassleriana]XP_010537349.1 PREDICTED: uncharacterized protein LOC104812078 [Tarenaya hassleriana]XP_010537350.1 PREDICTED: uncharacterized protein LOC104812078 [Tarenaya hassleriana]XP_010537352.1 PREDICTED: uncharacterized protein LOC104812078 [Tarenaya hassleriana]
MDVIDTGVEADDDVGRDTHMRRFADNGVLLAKAREFLVDEICQYLDGLEESNQTGGQNTDADNADNAGLFEDSVDDDTDPQYKFFLDNLREDGFLFMVEYNVSDGPPSCLTYEADDENVVENRKSRAVRNGKSLHRYSGSKRSSENVREGYNLRERKGKELRNLRNVPVVGKGNAQTSKGDIRQGRKNSAVKKKAKLKAKSFGSCKNMDVKDELVVDDCYKAHLMEMGHIKENPETKPEKLVEVKLEMDTESSCNSDIIAVADHPFSDDEYSPFVPAKKYITDVDEEDEGPVEVSNSLFRKELMDVLRKPYDEMEFVNLYRDVSIQKITIQERDLRNGRVRRETKILSAYIDQHPDLRELFLPWDGSTEFKDFSVLPIKDRHRALNLLRGFFFYIKNMVRDGAFKPWLDKECLETSCHGS